MLKLLFICSRNQWRSPTAEAIWRRDPRFGVRSAGTSAKARRTVTEADIQWADVIFVMETRHRRQLHDRFGPQFDQQKVHVLDIPDVYAFMDPELIEELTQTVEAHFDA